MILSVQARINGGVVGRLVDGTPYFAPLGQLSWDPDEDRVKCDLCGLWFRFLGSSHLRRTHGWTLARYREVFQLRGNVPTCSEQLSATHRADAQRRIDAEQVCARYLPPAGARRAPVVPRWRSLAVRHPELVQQLHSARNAQIDPLTIAAGSNQKLWWRCAAGHEWRATVHNRTAGWGCPECSAPAHVRRLRVLARAQARVPPERSLAAKRPELVAELHPTRNRGVDPEAIGYGSRRKLWWRWPGPRTRMARDGLTPRDQGHWLLPALLRETPYPSARRAQPSASHDRPDRALPRRASSRPGR